MFLGHNKTKQIEMDSDDEVFGEIQKLMKRNEPVNLALLNFHPARLFKILILIPSSLTSQKQFHGECCKQSGGCSSNSSRVNFVRYNLQI